MAATTESQGPLARLRSAADRNEGTSKLADALQDYLSVKATSVVNGAARRLGATVERLTSEGVSAAPVAAGVGGKLAQGKNPVNAVVTGGAKGLKDKAKKGLKDKVGRGLGTGSSGGGGKPGKMVNIVEDVDVGVPVRVAYNQWTRFPDFGSFAKGVQSAERTGDTSSHWRGKVFWSSRSWSAEVTEQVQDQRIAWSTEAAKGTMKGVVTFHPLGENLTRVLLVVEYYPKGLFERTGNIWRAQGRRLRLDLKHYRRQVMMLPRDEAAELRGWRGEVREGEVVLSHEDAVALEEADLTEEQWAELEELDPDERAELADLDPEEREELADLDDGSGDASDDGPEDGFEEEPQDGFEEEPQDEGPEAEDDEELEEEPEDDEGEEEEEEEFPDDEAEGQDADEADEHDLEAEEDEYPDEEERPAAERS
ncbi:SRPBCC family protein [Nocardiopsis sp. HUAS JQ3]|uniref:SRPBCC family protein n=1 Tax=Nocardiopsis sp. HUAS JQ3 TaxID=3061629 RepID=UPI0023A968DD|nr:SRPBCC family protein [Nocardiopsis sp. HUAS JQ3]WDZ88513.1 SRPBCC family protein [Nocardiopsis sp. HUAS JQ3]